MQPYPIKIVSPLPPTVWRYKRRHSWEDMPELVEMTGPLPEKPGEHATEFTVTLTEPGYYRLVEHDGHIRRLLTTDPPQGQRLYDVHFNGEPIALALLDQGEPERVVGAHLEGQGHAEWIDWLVLSPPPTEAPQPADHVV